MFSKDCFVASLLAMTHWFSFPAFAETGPAQCIMTIQSVELKNEKGEWLTVLEPDRQVDLAQEEPRVSFFNNGRVPPGNYLNFRLTVFGRYPGRTIEVFGKEDLKAPLVVKRGSFVGVHFKLDECGFPPKEIRELSVTVDEVTKTYGSREITIRHSEVAAATEESRPDPSRLRRSG